MPIKKVFTSDPGVYRVLPDEIDVWASSEDRDRIYDEYIWVPTGLMVMENPESPTDYEILFFCINRARITQGANYTVMRWSGMTGKFLGHRDTVGIGWRSLTVGANGTARASLLWILADHIYYKFDNNTFTFNEVHPPGYYEGMPSTGILSPPTIPCVDEEEDIALMINNGSHHSLREIAAYRESTGAFLYKFRVCGVAESIFMTDDRRAYVVANDGTLTLFNYLTGQVLSVMHVGLTDNYRAWAWDRVAKRILCFERTPDEMPLGTCTCRVTGYYPIPVAHGLAGPIPLQAPRIDTRVEMLTKVYGAAGEGIPGQVVNYSLETPTGTVVAPIQHTTDLNGNSRTYMTASLAGDNTLTATTVV